MLIANLSTDPRGCVRDLQVSGGIPVPMDTPPSLSRPPVRALHRGKKQCYKPSYKGGLIAISNTYGYIRVSTRDQNEDRQLIAMRELSIPVKNIFLDKQSGKDFERPQYKKLVKKLKPDDLLYIKSIDRLGRNYGEILEQWRILTKDLMGTFLSDIVLQVLSFVAENERTNIRKRQREGIAAAKARGVRFGRPPRPLPENYHSAYQRWKAGAITGTAAAKECGMPLSTFRYRAEIYEKAKLL